MSETLASKIREKTAKIAVVGLGHVGLPTAAIFADAGYPVIGTDVRERVVSEISSTKLVTKEQGLDELVERNVKAGRLKTINDTSLASKEADVVLICVQTPLTPGGKPDLKYIEAASRDAAKGLTKGKLIVVVSTVPPGTVKYLAENIFEKESGLKCGSGFKLAYCPERILPGNTIEEFVKNTRLLGGYDSESADMTEELLKNVIKGKILVTDIANAELAKLAENTFRYVNIAFANELAMICEKMGADVMEVISLANTHPRVNVHKPGPGVGGPCLTKDPQLLLHPEGHLAVKSRFIDASEKLNEHMANHTVSLAVKALKKVNKNFKNSHITVLGVTYKAEVSDTTCSPSEKIIRRLIHLGAEVRVYDPYSEEDFGAKKTKSIKEAANGSDCLVIATDHKMFFDISYKELKAVMNQNPVIVDARRILDFEKAKEEGFVYYGIGLGKK